LARGYFFKIKTRLFVEPIPFILEAEQPSLWPYVFLAVALVAIILFFGAKALESLFVITFKRPLYTHFYFIPKRLPKNEAEKLRTDFPFYSKLSKRQRRYFQHRLIKFREEKNFEGRDGFEVTTEVKNMISATAIMLTFGMRNFYLGALQKIIVYPGEFHSNTTGKAHKGEFNPLMRVLVLSWKDFEEGFANGQDKINLGIHEFTHVLQVNSRQHRSSGATIFLDANQELEDLLKEEKIRKKLLDSRFFRDYAFTNQYEFLAVLVEYFIESPKDFKENFPRFYGKIREMLNFRFAGY
jgi:Mlc titration factor MtfA (ptsG expression regulator)